MYHRCDKELKAKRRTEVVKLWQQGQVERVEEPSQQQWHQESNHYLWKVIEFNLYQLQLIEKAEQLSP
ncbi:hypothetical protein QYF36_015365 [Acer negundo]|nr:hypothetical protein QYF36_000952 [Acer negundo]KAK4842076.1 hypothetical protein QYF36_015365 [Acer negundo]